MTDTPERIWLNGVEYLRLDAIDPARHTAPLAISLAERDGAIIKAYQTGDKLVQLAEQYGLTVSGICGILRRHGIERSQKGGRPGGTHKPRQFTERDAAIVRLYESGKTLEELGASFDITRERVRQILVRAGCEERHRGRAKREARMITLVCPRCGKSRRIIPSQINRRNDAFCSAACRALANPNHSGRRAYLMRRDERLVWSEIGRRLGLVNPISRAKWWAANAGWDWPPGEYDGRKRRTE